MSRLWQHRLSRVTSLLFLAAGLVACSTGAIPEQATTTEPCVVEEYKPPNAVLGGTRMQPNPETSPEHCSDEAVLADYRAAMESALWYGMPTGAESCNAIEPPTDYPADMIDQLSTFYTGELLHTARETLYYNQQANPQRLVLACWDTEEFEYQFDTGDRLSIQWATDGRSVVVEQSVKDYALLTYEVHDGEPHLIEEVGDDMVGEWSFWETTMVYDTSGDGQWKISAAQNTIPD